MALPDRDTIFEALSRLDRRLGERDVRAELFLLGGAVMCLVPKVRPATKDVVDWFTETSAVRSAAKEVAEEMGLSEHWLNEAAKGFVPEHAGYEAWEALPHLTVSVADDRTLLAMKCAAARTPDDRADILFLANRLGLRSSAEILAVVRGYYPDERLGPRVRLLLEEMFDEGR